MRFNDEDIRPNTPRTVVGTTRGDDYRWRGIPFFPQYPQTVNGNRAAREDGYMLTVPECDLRPA